MAVATMTGALLLQSSQIWIYMYVKIHPQLKAFSEKSRIYIQTSKPQLSNLMGGSDLQAGRSYLFFQTIETVTFSPYCLFAPALYL